MEAIRRVKGTRDFYPEEMTFRRWLYARLREASEKFGYQEFDGPFLERLDLYAAKSGEELVKKQSFVFEDRGGEMVALRPELTPSLARMVAAKSRALPRPIRWWSFGPFWRYERPQRGRSREFFQWNIDLLGIESPEADAEIVAAGAEFLRSVGLSPDAVKILVNDRRLAESQLDNIGIGPDRRALVFRLIDRRDRMPPDKWADWSLEEGLSQEELEQMQVLLDDREAWRSSAPLQRFFEATDAMGVGDYVAYDPAVIRGLDYYTGTVFEARDSAGKFRAIFGGGRYDDLVSAVGGDPVPGTGFAMGDMVIRLVLEQYDATPPLEARPAEVLVTTFDEGTLMPALKLATEFRGSGLEVEWYPVAEKLTKQLKYANRVGARVAVILGPDEIAAETVTIRDLLTREQQSIPRREAAAIVSRILEA
ncbi:MAG: histidine--tRNA ligase [Anaerolineae bacterium]|nr:MAG: histidine--tRNA ligase [Anaerolineae bacterium]